MIYWPTQGIHQKEEQIREECIRSVKECSHLPGPQQSEAPNKAESQTELINEGIMAEVPDGFLWDYPKFFLQLRLKQG